MAWKHVVAGALAAVPFFVWAAQAQEADIETVKRCTWIVESDRGQASYPSCEAEHGVLRCEHATRSDVVIIGGDFRASRICQQ